KYAYTTLITRSSYLPGVIILADTLRKHGSQYPLLVFYPSSLEASAIKAMELEAPKTNLILQPCELLLPPQREGEGEHVYIAERFIDTWTKLRVFQAFGYDAVCYLDADISIFNSNMDSIFDQAADLPSDWIAANHACVCNLDSDPWAPSDWNVENCAYTPLTHPRALTEPTQPTPESRGTYHLLNSGMFLYHPSERLWEEMLHFFNTTDKLRSYKFPDQDFLADLFQNRWKGLGWQYNALKTMRYIHQDMWRDEEVVCLHYIVDKPWASRVGADGIAGFKGKDGVTHGWWWDQFESWRKDREGEEVAELV
ncbi:glycosyltransferase family 8 protein, partial [Baudoinia panamericana UAMH 10762]